MFSNFQDTFINKPQYTSKPPRAVIDVINDGLPEGFHYEYVEDGFCRLEADCEFNIQSGKIELPAKAAKVLDKDASISEVMSYCHNSQTPLIINPDENGGYVVNGEHFDVKNLVKAPLRNLEFSKAKLVVYPDKLDQELKFQLEGNGCCIPLVIHRVPNESIYVQKFESDDTQPIKVIFYLNPQNLGEDFSFTINLQIDKAKTSKDIIFAYKIFNAFQEGKGSIDGNPLEIKKAKEQSLVPENVISFWEKMNCIEKSLNVVFDITKPLRIIDTINIEALYRSLIDKKPFKQYRKYNSISGTGTFEDIFSKDAQQVYFEYEISETMDILGQTISLKGILGIFGAKVTSSNLPSKGELGPFEVFLEEAEGKKMYESKMFFGKEDDLHDFQKLENHIKLLEEAKELNIPESI